MKKSILSVFLLLNAVIVSAQCGNLGFEYGDYTGWTGRVGYNQNSQDTLTITGTGIFTNGPDMPVTDCSFFTLVDGAAAADPYGGFPAHYTGGGTWSERIGGSRINLNKSHCNSPYQHTTYSSGEILEQAFVVTPSNAVLILAIAVVLNTGGTSHLNSQQSYFRAQVLDSAGNYLSSCFNSYYSTDGTGVPGGFFQSATSAGGQPVYYRPWSIWSMVLSDYIGQTLLLRFTAAGCTLGEHFAYAYVDAFCAASPVIIENGSLHCYNDTTTLTAPLAIPAIYSWSGPGIVGSNSTRTITINAPGNYSVAVTSSGCTYTLDTTINTIDSPTAAASSTGTLCSGDSTGTATVIASGGTGLYTYSWSPVGGNAATASNLTAGNYAVTVTDANGCTAVSVTVVTEPPNLISTVTANDASCSTCSDGSAVASPLGGTGAYTYSWSTSPVQTTQTATNLSPAIYTCCVTDANGCTTCTSDTVSYPTIIGDSFFNDGFSISPNPFSTHLTITSASTTPTTITLYDYTGKEILRTKSNTEETVLNTEGLAAGFYLLRVESGAGVRNYKVVKAE
jgi:hypothetical protein